MAQPLATPVAPIADAGASYVDWPAIIAGAVLATAISFVLITFGAAIGLSAASPEAGEGVSLRWITIAAGLWFVWVVVSSNAAGGYLAGRLRRRVGDANADESETRDGAHGLLVWALGALLGAMLATSGISGVVRGTVAAAGAVGAGAASAAGGVAGALEGQVDYFAGLVQRNASPEAQAQVATVLMRSVREGELVPEDRQYLVDLVASETGAQPADVEAQVDASLARFEEARASAIEAADQARVAAVISAFVIAATLLAAAAVAYFAATLGGDHRDRNVAFRTMLR